MEIEILHNIFLGFSNSIILKCCNRLSVAKITYIISLISNFWNWNFEIFRIRSTEFFTRLMFVLFRVTNAQELLTKTHILVTSASLKFQSLMIDKNYIDIKLCNFKIVFNLSYAWYLSSTMWKVVKRFCNMCSRHSLDNRQNNEPGETENKSKLQKIQQSRQ